MRRWIATLGLTVIGCAPSRPTGETPAVTPAPPAATRPVVVYSPHGREVLEPFEQRFETAHPEIDLQWQDMGAQQVLDRLRAEQANPACDLWWGAPHTMFQKAAADGLLRAYRPSWADAAEPARRDPGDLWYGQFLTPIVIAFNSETLTRETAPHDWDELLEEQWAGRILIRNPLESGTMRTFFAAMILRQPTVEEGFAWLKRLDARTKAYPANPALLHRQLAARQGEVTVWVLRDVEIQKRINGYPLDYVIPASGCPTVLDSLALIKNSPHPADAELVYEYLTAPEQMVWAATEFDCMPAIPGVDPAQWPARMPRDLPEMKLDWAQIEAHGAEWMDRWDRTVKTAK